jgi:ABC-2 type transport system permease protein
VSKLWKVIAYEYRRHVLRRRFLFALFSVPLWVVAVLAISILAVVLGRDNNPVGYIDPAGILAHAPQPENEDRDPFEVSFEAFADESGARAALDAGQIQAYFILPASYPQVRDVELVYVEEPDNTIINQMSALLRRALLAGQPSQISELVMEGPDLNIITTQDDRQMQANDWFKVVAPIAAAILLLMAVFTSSGYLMQAVVEEKENRTMEILVTSISPSQIMSGKVIALIGVGLTQVLAWTLFPIIGLLVASAYLPFLQDVKVDLRLLGLMLLLIVPTFILIAALMAAVGATVTEAREGQQVSGLITLPVMVPFMLMGVLINNPGSPVALFLSFFPLTAALTVLLRMAFSSVPPWQVYLSAGILLASSAGSLWLAGRVFRLGMLRYGQRMGWKDVLQAMRRAA